jgi:hypothetical protein
MRSPENAGLSRTLTFKLLSEHVPAERDAALEGHRGEIGTLPSLGFRPGKQRRKEARYAGANKPQEAEIGPNGLDSTPVFRAVRAEMKQLNNPRKIVTLGGALNPRDVLHLRGKRVLDRSRDQRAAIGDEKLQQENDGTDENDCGHHRGITASLEGTSLASSGRRQNA